jgi:hypothetical protein
MTESGTTSASAARRRRAARAAAPLALAAALLLPAVADGAPKPGFAAGRWDGNGTISDRRVDPGVATTRWTGAVDFGLVVAGGTVSGTGTWRMTQTGSGRIGTSVLRGTARLRFSGTPTAVSFSGTQQVRGFFRKDGISTPLSMTRPLAGRLKIGRAGHCKVTGVSTGNEGRFRWTAVLKGAGTCAT